MNMPAFKHFVSHEMEAAQAQLSELLLVDSRDHPEIGLQGLKDDATIKTPGWSFLKDPRNAALLQGHDRWLLNWLTAIDELCKKFLDTRGPHEP